MIKNKFHMKKKSVTILIIMVVIISVLSLLFVIHNQRSRASKAVKHDTTQTSKQTSNVSSISSPNRDDPKYQMRIGPDGNPNDKPPTQTAWVDPNGGGYFIGDGPFDVPDQSGQHHWVDPEAAGWTKTTYDDITKSNDKY